MVLDGKSLQECLDNAGVPQESIICPTLLLLYINDLPDDVVCNIAIYTDDTTLDAKCDQASNLWHLNLSLIYKTLWTGAGSSLFQCWKNSTGFV